MTHFYRPARKKKPMVGDSSLAEPWTGSPEQKLAYAQRMERKRVAAAEKGLQAKKNRVALNAERRALEKQHQAQRRTTMEAVKRAERVARADARPERTARAEADWQATEFLRRPFQRKDRTDLS